MLACGGIEDFGHVEEDCACLPDFDLVPCDSFNEAC